MDFIAKFESESRILVYSGIKAINTLDFHVYKPNDIVKEIKIQNIRTETGYKRQGAATLAIETLQAAYPNVPIIAFAVAGSTEKLLDKDALDQTELNAFYKKRGIINTNK